jgi:hypothetical protein
MMKNEVKIYHKLNSLQGTVVPTLQFSGFAKDGETSLIGTGYIQRKEKLKKELMNKLKQTLAQYKIEHGDLREKNILEDISGFLILEYQNGLIEYMVQGYVVNFYVN